MQQILDSWFAIWAQSQYGYIGYQNRYEALLELFETLKSTGVDPYKPSFQMTIENFILMSCVPKKPKKKTKQEWIADVKSDISRARGAIFAQEMKTPDIQVKIEEDYESAPIKQADLDPKNVEYWEERFFRNKTSDDFYGK